MGETFDSTPMVLPIREHLDEVKRLLVGDYYIGRGCRQRGLGRSIFCNDFKVAVYGRQEAINRFAHKLSTDAELRARLWTLSGLRLLCHCTTGQACHGDIIISGFAAQFPGLTTERIQNQDLPLLKC